jgi:hypothetical protein
MKAKDLMIGNLIKTSSGKTGRISDGLDIDLIKGYKPIPLTDEWLVKFGFDLRGDEFPTIKDVLFLKNGLTTDCYEAIMISDKAVVKHVHQLQNLYKALTGEDLELKNK